MRRSSSCLWRHPAWTWLLVLAVICLAEYAVMLVLPRLLPAESSRLAESAADAMLLAVLVAPVLWWTVLRPLEQMLRIRTRFLGDLVANIESERARVAYELHNGVGQSVTLLVSGLRTLHATPEKADLPQRLLELQQMAQSVLQDIRHIALGLRPSLLDNLGLAPAIEQVATQIHENQGIELDVDVTDISGKRLPEAVETTVFRILQEALNNVVRHAAARRASVRVQLQGRAVLLEVSDDGRGIDPAAGADRTGQAGGLGLTVMRERATLLGGSLEIDSELGQGTKITAIIPVEGYLP